VNQEFINLFIAPELQPDFNNLPWEISLSDWPEHCPDLVEVARGLSRHPVEFVNIKGDIFAIKEMWLWKQCGFQQCMQLVMSFPNYQREREAC